MLHGEELLSSYSFLCTVTQPEGSEHQLRGTQLENHWDRNTDQEHTEPRFNKREENRQDKCSDEPRVQRTGREP